VHKNGAIIDCCSLQYRSSMRVAKTDTSKIIKHFTQLNYTVSGKFYQYIFQFSTYRMAQ